MQTVDNGDGTYTHTITANDIVVTDLFRMALAYGRRPVTLATATVVVSARGEVGQHEHTDND